jgi:hypothetical protein
VKRVPDFRPILLHSSTVNIGCQQQEAFPCLQRV